MGKLVVLGCTQCLVNVLNQHTVQRLYHSSPVFTVIIKIIQGPSLIVITPFIIVIIKANEGAFWGGLTYLKTHEVLHTCQVW